MAAIHGKNTKPEMVVRRYLWGAWLSLSSKQSTIAWQARHRDAEVQDVYLCEWMFLART